MKFIDQTEIKVQSGDGGDGLVSFRTARNLPKLGADGGDGGFGGHVYAVADPQINTLSKLRYKQWYKAGHGQKGGTNNKTGRNGEDCIIPMPLGTIIRDKDTGEVIGELLKPDDKIMLAKGGKRGLGNVRYLSPTHQAPTEHKLGGKGETFNIALELKLMADIGLAGFPNAGKSTLLSTLSNAKPKVADYPFTTLTPNLGVVETQDVTGEYGSSLVMADIPGLIEGASVGRGLGHEFLKHLERTKAVIYLIDGFSGLEEPYKQYEKLRSELENFSKSLSDKGSLIVINKIDLVPPEEQESKKSEIIDLFKNTNLEILFISNIDKSGLTELKRHLVAIKDNYSTEDEVE